MPPLCALAAGLALLAPQRLPNELIRAFHSINGYEILNDVKTLASDEFEGRAPGSHGEALTVRYLVNRYKEAGLKPGAPDGSFVQQVPLTGIVSKPSAQFWKGGQGLRIADEELALRSKRNTTSIQIPRSKLLFAGYGIVAPEYGWDDFRGVDVRGKVLLVLDGEPKLEKRLFKGDLDTYYSTRNYKFELAANNGAAAILVVHDPLSTYASLKAIQNSYRRESFQLASANIPPCPVEGWISQVGAERLCGRSLATLRALALSRGFRARALAGDAAFSGSNTMRQIRSRNVIAKVEGSDPALRKECLIYTAHWDHLGRDTSLKGDQIYNGAIDNAGGTGQLLEIAEGFAKVRPRPRRSIVFLSTTAEERGYLGARYYLEHPTIPLAKTVANLNLDSCNVWGRTTDVNDLGFGFTNLDAFLAKAARIQGRTFVAERFAGGSYYFLSDQIEFARAGIPAAFPGSGTHYVDKPAGYGDSKWNEYGAKAYHQVSDEVQPDWDMRGAQEDARWLLIAGYLIAQSNERPKWLPDSEFSRRN